MVVPGQDDSCLTGSSSMSSSASTISSSTSLIPSSTSITSGSTNTISSSASAISSSASASSDPSASKTPAVANADGNKPALNLAWVAGLVVGLAAVIIGAITAFFIVRCRRRRLQTRPFLHAGTLPNNEMSQPRREGAGGLEVAAHLLGASPQIPEGHSAITPPPLSFDRGPFTSHDQSHDSLLHGGTSEKEGLSGETLSSFLKGLVGLTSNATAASEINISTSPSTSRDVDGGIAFSDDGVPDILPPDYEDRRPATIQVR
ncbi:hypothetical protein IEO21_01732 [Rhodonia placenta]|uniref:Uncharacterized protein n=1 Tax=Rhodonia placenta TaxID=104341 RepID=A0A8H7U544_9APHY|nr:hypothetical protein IEO21_01732 [Postia placenta]